MHGEMVRFFNGGDKFNAKFVYTKPNTDFKEENGLAYWPVKAERGGFFEVPREMQLPSGDSILLRIHQEITERYGERGVIRIDANLKDLDDENPEHKYLANTEAMAKAKGQKYWKEYMRKVVTDFEEENERRVMQKNLPARKAADFVVHAYKELGLQPPGEDRWVKAGLQTNDVADLKDTVRKQQELIEKLLAQAEPDKTSKKQAGA